MANYLDYEFDASKYQAQKASRPFRKIFGDDNPAVMAGFETLMDILNAKGKTDPALLNTDLRRIQMYGDQAAQATQGDLARANLRRSGVGQAVSAAQRTATANKLSDRMAQETAMAEARKRQDVQGILQMLFGPAMSLYQSEVDERLAREQIEMQKKRDKWNAIGALLGAAGAFTGAR